MSRALLRMAKGHGCVREGMAQGCPEHFDLEFLRYVWNFSAQHRPRILAALESHGSHIRLYRLAADRDAERLLRELSVARAKLPDFTAGQS